MTLGSSKQNSSEITRLIQFVGFVRIFYGVLAIFAPKVWPKVFRTEDRPDTRLWNAFLGSRDIAIGVHSMLHAKNADRLGDVILINQGCEIGDTVLNVQEVRQGRNPKSFVVIAGLIFNGVMHAIWIRVLLLRRG